MNRLRGLIAAPILALALIAVPTAAHAGGSDSPTPYTVDSSGITLPGSDTFPAHGHVNLTTSQGGKGIHFDPNNGHPGAQWIGASYIPWSAFGLTTCDTVSWVQIHGYNEHYGEGGQPPIVVGSCAPQVEEPPVAPPPTPAPVVLTNHTCDAPGSIAIPATDDVVYRLGFESEGGVWVALPAGTYPATVGVGLEGNAGHPRFGEPIFDTLTVAAHQVSTWPNEPLATWVITFTDPGECAPPIPPKPKAKKGIDFRADAICTAEPATGDLVTTLEKRAWTRDWVLVDNAWKLGEKVYGDWEVVESASVPWPKCQPDPLTGVEVRDGGPICVEPLDGTATVATETRTWTQTASWNWKKGWVYGEVVYGDWEVETVTVEAEACAPPPADEPPAPPLEAERLATTGTEGVLEGMLAAVAILLAGAGVIFGRIIWDRRAERRSREQ